MKRLILPVLFAIVLIFMACKEFNESKSKIPDGGEKASTFSESGIVILELFTSQGCSSCPPADVQLEKAKNEYPEKVFALSYHVDYWNYIGWEDPFSKKAYTLKQQEYNRKFKSKRNYTPQLVVNGLEHFVGSNSVKIKTKIQEYLKQKPENSVYAVGKKEGSKVDFSYDIEGDLRDKKIRAVLVLNESYTQIDRGENKNRTLKNSNIVVAEKYVEISTNEGSGFIEIPKIAAGDKKISLMLLIQKDNLDITGAAKVEIDS